MFIYDTDTDDSMQKVNHVVTIIKTVAVCIVMTAIVTGMYAAIKCM